MDQSAGNIVDQIAANTYVHLRNARCMDVQENTDGQRSREVVTTNPNGQQVALALQISLFKPMLLESQPVNPRLALAAQ